ncbi:nitric oxide reductase activation protein NorD [Thalassovita taeanensis]|uniref:Nitric oxide reductase NorD protein n=1 Tax=Thalassovita taeanensis TaxID=657014 RepID=A0A1H9GDP1_9RHOB|nr:VWA domain-containing protein [Thalassovita taeanensis]SEQ48197.1 nitric oxide reductase NorD protein [Thalassovita taeanensis]
MALHFLDLMEPEETVGKLWHDYASGIGARPVFEDAAVDLAALRPSLSVLFRALGGSAGVEIVEAPAVPCDHRRPVKRRIGTGCETQHVPSFDGERLRLPPRFDCFDSRALNKAAYLWLTALAALTVAVPDVEENPRAADRAQVRANTDAADRAWAACPGLREAHARLCAQALLMRPHVIRPADEAALEQMIRNQLNGHSLEGTEPSPQIRGYLPFAPVPVWLRFSSPGSGAAADDIKDDAQAPPTGAATTTRKIGLRKDASEANRKDSFIMHRFESILSWVESMNINRSVDDNDDEHAQKAAEDQDNITLSKHDRRTATRLRMHLDLSPTDAEHERLAGSFTYPEWNHRTRAYMDDHCRVLETDAHPDPSSGFRPNARHIREVRRQFEALRPRRILRPRQIDGAELDLDALIAAQVELRATGRTSDRIYQSARQIERDLAVAFLVDTSRSTEAAVGDTSVIDVARDALAALATGIDASGDRLGIWGFSSLRRDRVFMTRCKGFETPMSPEIINNICALRPGHYTRLGAAVRHTSALLAEESAARKLLIILTDGKPNDLDHYEGQHGIEDSHMAIREARRAGQTVHGVIIDEDGQDWFARIFGRGSFSLLPQPQRLTRALPDIYRSLTQET